MRFISRTLGCLFRLILVVICFSIVSAWLQSQGMSWMDLGKYLLEKGVELITKVGQVILSIDWSIK